MPEKISGGLRYTGAGAFWPGLPTRDLTAEDVKKLNQSTLQDAVAAGLYEPTGDRQARPGQQRTEEDNRDR